MSSELRTEPTFKLVNKLVFISAFYRVEDRVFDIPSREDTAQYAVRFWQNWDSCFPIIDELVRRKRDLGISVESTTLWGLVKGTIRSIFNEKYEYCRKVSVPASDFEAICKAVINENAIVIGNLVVQPIGDDFYTDAYGQDNFGTIWGYSKSGGEFEPIARQNDWELAMEIFGLVNDHQPSPENFGEQAEKLDSYSWSIYDPVYVPLRKRVSEGCFY